MTFDEVYILFRTMQVRVRNNRPYRRPKDIGMAMAKLSEDDIMYLNCITKVFVESHIEPELYFKCGFDVFGKNFIYRYFLDDRIMVIYNEAIKARTKKNEYIVKSFKKSYEHFRLWVAKDWTIYGNKYAASGFLVYCMKDIDGIPAPVYDCKHGNICKYFITWLVYKGWLKHADNPLDHEYREILGEIRNTNVIPL